LASEGSAIPSKFTTEGAQVKPSRTILLDNMRSAFSSFTKIPSNYAKNREDAWMMYVMARETYLLDCWGVHYKPLHETLRKTGPYD
jgi:hypothetical protein